LGGKAGGAGEQDGKGDERTVKEGCGHSGSPILDFEGFQSYESRARTLDCVQ
jgi:hypothetical protein